MGIVVLTQIFDTIFMFTRLDTPLMHESADTLFDIRDYGATGDGEHHDTDAIQSALDDCAASGGTVYVPAGDYLSAPLTVSDQTTLHVAAGATLRFVRDASVFPTVTSRWEGWNQVGFHPCLWITDAATVEITGRGTIDGQGDYWWGFYDVPTEELPEALAERIAEFHTQNDKQDDVSSFTLRPPLFQISRSENVTVSGVTLRNSPFWNTHIVYSKNVTFHDVNIENPAHAPNGDGIDIDSSQHVRISDTYINAGDDAICIKSGKNKEGRDIGRPASQITVTNCTIEAGHGGIVIGSEMSGDVRDVVVNNCTFTDTDRGIRIKTKRGRGGVVEDLRFGSIVMRRVACPFVINGYYFTDIDDDPVPTNEGTPMVKNVHFHDITARNVESAGFLAGLPEQHFAGITFSNVDIDATRPLDTTDLNPAMADNYEQRHGFFCKSLADLSLSTVRIRTADDPVFTFEECGSVTIDGLWTQSSQQSPIIRAENVDTTVIRGYNDLQSEGEILHVGGPETDLVSVADTTDTLTDWVVVDDDAGDVQIETP